VKYFILFNSDKIVFFYIEKISLWRCQVSNGGLAGDATEYLSVGEKIRSKTGNPTSHINGDDGGVLCEIGLRGDVGT